MITLQQRTADLIKNEMESVPAEYHKPFNSAHEGLGVLREEYIELEQVIFFGYKEAKKQALAEIGEGTDIDWRERVKERAHVIWQDRIREEAVQVAAMAARVIQDLTYRKDG